MTVETSSCGQAEPTELISLREVQPSIYAVLHALKDIFLCKMSSEFNSRSKWSKKPVGNYGSSGRLRWRWKYITGCDSNSYSV